MTYALDTNIIIKYLRNSVNITQRYNNAINSGYSIAIPKIVDYEIRRGFRILPAPKKEAAYQRLIGTPSICSIVEMDESSWERAEQVYEELYHKGFTVDEMDILIAAICLENNYTLVTNNEKDFKNISGLTLVNWAN